eukprot:174830-Amphidinium_carterae.2
MHACRGLCCVGQSLSGSLLCIRAAHLQALLASDSTLIVVNSAVPRLMEIAPQPPAVRSRFEKPRSPGPPATPSAEHLAQATDTMFTHPASLAAAADSPVDVAAPAPPAQATPLAPLERAGKQGGLGANAEKAQSPIPRGGAGLWTDCASPAIQVQSTAPTAEHCELQAG